jgi:hypothetical protein
MKQQTRSNIEWTMVGIMIGYGLGMIVTILILGITTK